MSQEEKTTAPAAGSPAPGQQPEGTAQEKLEALAEEARSLLRSEDSQREDTLEGKVTWRSFVSGEILLNPAFRRQIPLLIVILLFTIVYIDNRFAVLVYPGDRQIFGIAVQYDDDIRVAFHHG